MNRNPLTRRAAVKLRFAVVLILLSLSVVFNAPAPRAQTPAPAKPDAAQTPANPSDAAQTPARPAAEKPAEAPTDATVQTGAVALKALPAKGKRYALIIGVDK